MEDQQDSKLVKALKKWNHNIDLTKNDMYKFALKAQGNDVYDEGQGFMKKFKFEMIINAVLLIMFGVVYYFVGFKFAWFFLLIIGIKFLTYCYDILRWLYSKGLPKAKQLYQTYMMARKMKEIVRGIENGNRERVNKK